MTAEMIFWLAAIVLFALVEAATVSVVSVWFCGGAVVALIVAALGAPVLLQVVVFLAVSAGLLAGLRPLARKLSATERTRTNADRIIGSRVAVTEAVDPIAGTGAVRVQGIEWSAVSDVPIAAGTIVVIVRIEGVKAVVTPESAVS